MTQWQGNDDDFTPVFVDTTTSDDEAPRDSGGLFLFVLVVIGAVVALATFGLLRTGDDQPDVGAEPTPAPTQTPTDGLVEVAVADTWSPGSDPIFRLFSDGEVLCLRSSDGSIRETCGPIDDTAVDRAFFTAIGGRPLLSSWCAAGAVGAEVQSVALELLDGSRSSTRLSRADNGERQYFAACRTDGVGLGRVRYLSGTPAETEVAARGGDGGALVPGAVTLPPPIVEIGAPPGWARAQVGGVEVIANRPIEVPAVSGDPLDCTTPQLAVLANASPDAVIVSVVELRGPTGLPSRAEVLPYRAAQPAPLFDCPLPGLDIRTTRFADGVRLLEVAIATGVDATPGDIADAEETVGLLGIVPRPDTAPPSSVAPPPVPVSDDAAVAWTGTEVLVWGGSYDYTTSAFDPLVTRLLAEGVGYPVPLATAASDSGARWDPATNTWRLLPEAPLSMSSAGGYRSVWTGSELLVWTAGLGRGLAFDPATDIWRVLPEWTPGVGFGWEPPIVWTGTEVIAFGPAAVSSEEESSVATLGARYDPLADTWALLPRPPETIAETTVAVWTGTEALFLLGRQGLAFDPLADRWRETTGPEDGDLLITDAVLVGDQVLALSRFDQSQFQIGTLYSALVASLDDWQSEIFPGQPIGVVDVVLRVDGALFAISTVVDGPGGADGGSAAYLRDVDGDVSPVSLPEGWNRCDATPVALSGRVFFWGGFECDTGRALGDATVIDLARSDSVS